MAFLRIFIRPRYFLAIDFLDNIIGQESPLGRRGILIHGKNTAILSLRIEGQAQVAWLRILALALSFAGGWAPDIAFRKTVPGLAIGIDGNMIVGRI